MHYRVAALMLLAVLPGMNVLAAPAPAPFAILDIGPPPKGVTAEQYRKAQIDCLTYPYGMLSMAWCDPEVRMLPSVAPLKDARPWLVKNLRIAEEVGARHLRLSFQAGNRAEQAAILNALLRVNLRLEKERIELYEKNLRNMEAGTPRLAKLLKEERDGNNLQRYQQEWEASEVRERELRAEIARLKQIDVIRWAK